jgi:hypothetical protein
MPLVLLILYVIFLFGLVAYAKRDQRKRWRTMSAEERREEDEYVMNEGQWW